MEPISHRIKGAHGLELHLLEWSTEGVPLVLLHGLGNEAHLWDDFVPSVAPHYRVLALDQRGHGDSDWDPEARYDALARARAERTRAYMLEVQEFPPQRIRVSDERRVNDPGVVFEFEAIEP